MDFKKAAEGYLPKEVIYRKKQVLGAYAKLDIISLTRYLVSFKKKIRKTDVLNEHIAKLNQ